MLRTDVVEAVAAGKFHIYPVTTVDEGIQLLTGIEAGELDQDGNYPEGSFNGRVVTRLIALAEKQRAFNTSPAANGQVEHKVIRKRKREPVPA